MDESGGRGRASRGRGAGAGRGAAGRGVARGAAGRGAAGRGAAGRGRGQAPPQQQQQPQQPPAQAQAVAGVAQQMAQVSLGGAPAQAPAPAQAAPAQAAPAQAPAPAAAQPAAPPAEAGGDRDFGGECLVPAAFADRPRYGQYGRPLNGIVANAFKVLLGSDLQTSVFYQYHVNCVPERGPRVVRALVYKSPEIKAAFNDQFAFDGGQAYSLHRLPQKDVEFTVVDDKRDDEALTITFRLTASNPFGSPVLLQMFNIILRNFMKNSTLTLIGRNHYDCSQVKRPGGPLKGQIEIYPGFDTSIRNCDGGVLLVVDNISKIVRTDTAATIMEQAQKEGGNAVDKIKGMLIGETVLTRHNNKMYRIIDVDFESNATQTFKGRRKVTRGGEYEEFELSFIEYFSTYHHTDIPAKYHRFPLVIAEPKEKVPQFIREKRAGEPTAVKIPAAICTMTGLTDAHRSNFQFMKGVSENTAMTPQERVNATSSFVRSIHEYPKANNKVDRFQEFSVRFDANVVAVPARLIESHPVCARPKGPARTGQSFKQLPCDARNPDFSRDIKNSFMWRPEKLEKWYFIHTDRCGQQARTFLNECGRVFEGLGMQCGAPHIIKLDNDRPDTFTGRLQDNIRNVGEPTFVVCMLPNNAAARYNSVKRFLLLREKPISSQCVLASKYNNQKNVLGIITKVGMQINCKLGGALWIPKTMDHMRGCMTVGLDVWHKKGSANSVGALVATLTVDQDRFYSQSFKMNFQGQETISGLSQPLRCAIGAFVRGNKAQPRNIVFYRDGVGKGQLNHIRQLELNQVYDCLDGLRAEGKITNPVGVMYVIVQKRVMARFYMKGRAAHENVPFGMIVDRVVTDPELYEFYLCNQTARVGCVCPTRYLIVHDTTRNPPNMQQEGTNPDDIQRWTYMLTHTYYNWPGCITVPAPCLYAHKLAYFQGEVLGPETERTSVPVAGQPNTMVSNYIGNNATGQAMSSTLYYI